MNVDKITTTNGLAPKKYKKVRWLNRTDNTVFYGISALVDGKWYNCLEDDKPMFFDIEKDATDKVKELNTTLKPS